jgi:hypothetical protein
MAANSSDREVQGISVLDVFWRLWRQRLVIAAFIGAAFLIGVVQVHRAAQSYTITLKVTSVSLQQSQAQVSNRLNGLASLAGVALPSSANGLAFDLYLEQFKDREVGNVLAANPDIMHRMFAGEWDAEAQRWRQPSSLLRPVMTFVKGIFGIRTPAWQPPDGARVQDFINGMVTISKSPYSPVVTITMQSADPKWGQKLLWTIHQAVDNSLRDKTLEREGRYIDYLKAQLAGTTIGDYRASLVSTLIDQEKQRMVASSGLAFAADPVEAPTASHFPTEPHPMSILMKMLVFGALAGCAAGYYLEWRGVTARVLLRNWYRAATSRARRVTYYVNERSALLKQK